MSAKKYFTPEEKAAAAREHARKSYHKFRETKLAAQKIWRDSEAGKDYRAKYQSEWRAENYDRVLELNRKSRKKNRIQDRPLYAAQQRDRRKRGLHLKSKFGITPEQWTEMQARGCGICGTMENLCVDHCHSTGKVRGALCRQHNSALGMFNEEPMFLQKAIEWIGGHPALNMLYSGGTGV